MTPLRKILVVEDEAAIRRGIVDALRFAGYEVEEAADGEEGLARAVAPGLDLVLLDLMMPKMDGFTVLKEARKARPRLPVIILTARGAEDDRVRGLKGGADDYVVKPFSAKELLARVEAVLRRSAERPNPLGALELGGARVDFERREIALADGTRQELTDKEGALLSYLAESRGRAVSRKEILERVWGIDATGLDTRAVDMLVARLRAKLGPGGEDAVRTVRGTGYAIGEAGE
ncbi:MAG: response regulator transcription factor [Planctomycetes bacterium]|nr:response regulator transcription factor [Planctomycetota bacterium]